MSRPRLKGRCIARNGREIAIMKPVQNLLLLTQTNVSLAIFAVLATTVPQRSLCADFGGLGVVCLLPAAADEQHVADFDVATLGSGSDVDALIFAALVELLPRDWVVVVGVIVDASFVGVAAVVEQYTTAGDTVFSPVMD